MVTFDQPLWLKATLIKHAVTPNSLIKSVVIRLGGFHTQMSFMGSIGHIMTGSGLFQVLETIYATNSIPHIMSGKAVSRAVRGHLLVYASLQTMLTANALHCPLPTADGDDDTDVLDGTTDGVDDTTNGVDGEPQGNSDLDTVRDLFVSSVGW